MKGFNQKPLTLAYQSGSVKNAEHHKLPQVQQRIKHPSFIRSARRILPSTGTPKATRSKEYCRKYPSQTQQLQASKDRVTRAIRSQTMTSPYVVERAGKSEEAQNHRTNEINLSGLGGQCEQNNVVQAVFQDTLQSKLFFFCRLPPMEYRKRRASNCWPYEQ